jgi:hypothetical protein
MPAEGRPGGRKTDLRKEPPSGGRSADLRKRLPVRLPPGVSPKDRAARLRRAFEEATIRWPNSRSDGSRDMKISSLDVGSYFRIKPPCPAKGRGSTIRSGPLDAAPGWEPFSEVGKADRIVELLKRHPARLPLGVSPKDRAARLCRAFDKATIWWPNSRSAGSRYPDLNRRLPKGSRDMKIEQSKTYFGTDQAKPDTRIYTDKPLYFSRKGTSLFLRPAFAGGGFWSSLNPALTG